MPGPGCLECYSRKSSLGPYYTIHDQRLTRPNVSAYHVHNGPTERPRQASEENHLA